MTLDPKYVFPMIPWVTQWKWDEETLSYATYSKDAEIQTDSILLHMRELEINEVIDATGGHGSNTLHFLLAPEIHHVTTYEIDPSRIEMIRQNVALAELQHKSTVINGSLEIPQNGRYAVFVDPPWGGADYRKVEQIDDLTMGNISFRQYLSNLTKHPDKFPVIALKLPFNYNRNFTVPEPYYARRYTCHTPSTLFVIFSTLDISDEPLDIHEPLTQNVRITTDDDNLLGVIDTLTQNMFAVELTGDFSPDHLQQATQLGAHYTLRTIKQGESTTVTTVEELYSR
jgi:hypothetical protein